LPVSVTLSFVFCLLSFVVMNDWVLSYPT
jgi:hypothetical protein